MGLPPEPRPELETPKPRPADGASKAYVEDVVQFATIDRHGARIASESQEWDSGSQKWDRVPRAGTPVTTG
jgi:hypothetical protein